MLPEVKPSQHRPRQAYDDSLESGDELIRRSRKASIKHGEIQDVINKALSQPKPPNEYLACAQGALNAAFTTYQLLRLANSAKGYIESKYGDKIEAGKKVFHERNPFVRGLDSQSNVQVVSDDQASKLSGFSPVDNEPLPIGMLKDRSAMKAAGIVGDTLHKGSPLISASEKNYELPRLDEMRGGIKTALVEARREAKLDGNGKESKVNLNQIVGWTSDNFPDRDDGKVHGGKHHFVSELSVQHMENLVGRVAPHVDAYSVVKEAFKQGGGGDYKSHECVSRLALAAIREIAVQSYERGFSVNKLEELRYLQGYSSRIPQFSSSFESDRGHEVPNPYSPLGAPGANRDYSYEINREFAMGGGHPYGGEDNFAQCGEHSDRDTMGSGFRAFSEAMQAAAHGTAACACGPTALGGFEGYQAVSHGREALREFNDAFPAVGESYRDSFRDWAERNTDGERIDPWSDDRTSRDTMNQDRG